MVYNFSLSNYGLFEKIATPKGLSVFGVGILIVVKPLWDISRESPSFAPYNINRVFPSLAVSLVLRFFTEALIV